VNEVNIMTNVNLAINNAITKERQMNENRRGTENKQRKKEKEEINAKLNDLFGKFAALQVENTELKSKLIKA